MNKKKFSEVKGKTPFSWSRFLNRNPAGISNVEMREVALLSCKWVSCACGNQCNVIPRWKTGEPKDDLLRSSGFDFFQYIRAAERNHKLQNFDQVGRDFRYALEELKRIEKRSTEIMQDIIKKKLPAIRKEAARKAVATRRKNLLKY